MITCIVEYLWKGEPWRVDGESEEPGHIWLERLTNEGEPTEDYQLAPVNELEALEVNQ